MLELLYQALRETYGIRVRTDNLKLLREKLYALRNKHEELKALSLVQSPFDPNELWIVKTRKDTQDGKESS